MAPLLGAAGVFLTAVATGSYGHAEEGQSPAGPRSAVQGDATGSAGQRFDLAAGRAFIEENCLSCHGETRKSGNLVLTDADLGDPEVQLALWEAIARRVGGGEMPPADARRKPAPEDAAAFSHWLVDMLDQHAIAHPNPGRPIMRRLNRAEYSNAVRDLLAIDIKPAALLAPDSAVGGFTNNERALTMSPMALEKYLGVARQVTRQAIGDPSLPRTIYDFPVPDDQMAWLPGLPFGARGGIAVDHYFPISGDYIIRTFTDRPSKLPAAENRRKFEVKARIAAGSHRVVVSVAEELALAEGSVTNIRSEAAPVTPGPIDPMMSLGNLPYLDVRIGGQRLGFLPVQPPSLTDLNTQNGLLPGQVFINRIEVDGPFKPSGPGMTASRRRIFICQPKAVRDEVPCAQKIMTAMTRRAFRRDITAADVEPFIAAFTRARTGTSFEHGIQEALQSLLVAPEFLFRVEADPHGAKPGSVYRINDFALASRISFFLWSSIPDDELLDLAAAGKLRDPATLAQQTRRMLRDPRASALVENFGMEFLGLGELEGATPDPSLYPGFTKVLKDQFREETRLFLASIFSQNRSVTDIVGANYTYLNENLARHYGIKNIVGAQFRRVDFQPGNIRGGILGQGSILLTTSHPNLTSPVLRGKWVLATLLNAAPPPPPPDVPALEAVNHDGRALTGREQMEQHRTNPSCSGCHARMDPYGFALENFNVVGRWREKEDAGPINAEVSMPDGSTFKGVNGLRERLLGQKRALAEAFAARLFSYALGRQLEGYDWPVVRKQVVDKAPGYRFEEIVLGIVNSSSFQTKRMQGPST